MAEEDLRLPCKKHFRQRAHSNPLGDHSVEYPVSPETMDWSKHFPKYFPNNASLDSGPSRQVEILDIGCGYGGLLLSLSTLLPETLIVGMELRVKVSEYVQERIKILRQTSENETMYQNIACVRTNAMKYLPAFVKKGQLQKAFILFPDPHFKKQKHKWRIVSPNLLAEYAYVMAVNGLIYTITDVLEVHEWIVKHFMDHLLFEKVCENELESDPCYKAIFVSTEEGQKVSRNKGAMFPAVFRRIACS